MRVGVLGASGFVGGHILRVLRAHGDDARAIVRNPHFAAGDSNARLADALDVYALRDALAGCDGVVHSVLGPQEVILGSLAPMYAAAEALGIARVVYISTGTVHGQSPPPGTTETSRLHVRHPFAYNNSKVRAERKLRRLRRRGTVEIVMLRPTIVFGPGSRWVSDFARALQADSAYVVDGGLGICNSIYVDNLGHAVRLALTAPGVDGQAFLVGDTETVTWADLNRRIAEGLGYDFDAVPSVSPPDVTSSLRDRYVEPLRTSELGQQIIAALPLSLKATVRGAVRTARHWSAAFRGPGHDVVPAAMPPRPLSVSAELVALQRCRWRLPNDKATTMLGYAAPISFEEGCRRSVEWLKRQGCGTPRGGA